MNSLKFSSPHSILIWLATLLLWYQFDHVINTQNGYGSFCGKLERLHFGHSGFQHTSLLVVTHQTCHQVQPHPVQHKPYRKHLCLGTGNCTQASAARLPHSLHTAAIKLSPWGNKSVLNLWFNWLFWVLKATMTNWSFITVFTDAKGSVSWKGIHRGTHCCRPHNLQTTLNFGFKHVKLRCWNTKKTKGNSIIYNPIFFRTIIQFDCRIGQSCITILWHVTIHKYDKTWKLQEITTKSLWFWGESILPEQKNPPFLVSLQCHLICHISFFVSVKHFSNFRPNFKTQKRACLLKRWTNFKNSNWFVLSPKSAIRKYNCLAVGCI